MGEIYKVNGQELALLVAGGLSGGISRTAVAPLSRIKLLYQIHHMKNSSVSQAYTSAGITGMFQQVLKNEGFLAFWKGNGTMVLKKIPYSAIKYLSYEKYKDILTKHGELNATTSITFLSGCLAACTSVIFTYPLDLVQVHLTAQTTTKKYGGLWDAIRRIVNDEGFLQLYRGLGAGLFTVVPYLGISLSIWEKVKTIFKNDENLSQLPKPVIGGISGAISGAIASTFTFPLDLIRRHLQLNTKMRNPDQNNNRSYKGFVDCVTSIYRNHGIRGFYRGLYVHYLTVIPSVALSLGSYDLLKAILKIEERERRPF